MSIIKSDHEPHKTYAQNKRAKESRERKKRVFRSIAEYENDLTDVVVESQHGDWGDREQ